MNKIFLLNSKYSNKLWYYFVAFILLLFSSCSKDDQKEMVKGGPIKLVINIKGFYEDNNFNKQASTKINELDNEGGVILDRKTYNGALKEGRLEIDLISSINDVNLSSIDRNIKSFSKLSKLATVFEEDMAIGVTYCFMIYKDNGNGEAGDLIDIRLGSVGSPMEAWVNEEDSFVWYAYSFNSSEPISLPDSNNPTITTTTTSPLLYAKGTLSQSNIASSGGNLPILFNQKLSKVEVEVDTRSLFADIINITANFDGTPISEGVFSIKSGVMTSTNPVDVGNIQMRNINVGSSRLKENITNYYTATALTSISVQFTEFTIQHPNRVEVNLLPQLLNNGVAEFPGFIPNNDGTGKLLKATLRPFLVLPSKKFLTLGTSSLDGNLKGFAANADTESGSFLRSAYNIGRASNYIRMETPAFRDLLSQDLSLTNTLSSNLTDYSPDVVIAAIFAGEISDADLESLEQFVLSGGVLFLLTETTDTRIQAMLRDMMMEPNLTLVNHSEDGGIYKLNDIDPDVLDGIFGDVGGAYWGQDGSGSQYMEGISDLSKLNVYTNGSVNYTPQTGVTMFRHKQRSLFFVGDTGFLASERSSPSSSFFLFPYLVNASPNYFPILRPGYGTASVSGSYESGSIASWTVSNSLIFGNALAWLIERAHFYGRNFNGTSVESEFFQTKENNWNYNRN